MVWPIALSASVHEFEPTQAQGVMELNHINLCVDDDIVDVVEEDKTNMIALEENRVASSDENSSRKTSGETS